MSDKKKSNDSGIYFLFAIAVMFFIYKLIERIIPVAFLFYQRHWIAIAFLSSISVATFVGQLWDKIAKKRSDKIYKDFITSDQGEDSVYAGIDEKGKKVFIPLSARKMHTQIVGTTNAGKTESVIIPWAVDDIAKKRGLIMLDGKSDSTLVDKIYAYSVKNNRQNKFKYFSLTNIQKSHTFNPLLGGSVEEVSERVFNAFNFENEYYRGVQYEIFSQILRIFKNAQEVPTFLKTYQAISNTSQLRSLVDRCTDQALVAWGNAFIVSKSEEREKKVSGILSQIANFAFGDTACLFNVTEPSLDIDSALKNDEALFFQLPVLKFPNLGRATGKLVLQCLQSEISNRHQLGSRNHTFFSCYLDDFSEFMPPSFVSLLNKSRSASVGIAFAHQALGDLKALGDDIENTILVNSNLKIFMRTNEPVSAEYFSKVGGTVTIEKSTERQSKNMGIKQRTGEASVRDAEEFVHHPNLFKKGLGLGEAVVMIPHTKGVKTVKLKFSILPDLEAQEMPDVSKEELQSLKAKENKNEENTVNKVFKKEVPA